LLRLLDEYYTRWPYYRSRRLVALLRRHVAFGVNRKRVQRLRAILGLEAICPRRRLTRPAPGHQIYPYLLHGVVIQSVNQVWSSDITYIRLQDGFGYLTAVMDWFSRFVLSWAVSNTIDAWLCREALDAALTLYAQPEIFNTDQGSTFTNELFVIPLKERKIRISMDGRGRALTTPSSSGCGAPSSTNTSICTSMPRWPICAAVSLPISTSTTSRGRTRRCSIAPPPRSSLPTARQKENDFS